MRWTAVLLMLTACAGKSTPASSVTSAPPARLDGYVLVWSDAWIGHGDNVGRVEAPSGRETGDVKSWKIVSDDGERLQVQNVRSSDTLPDHCYSYIPELEDYELTVTVARADLVPVTRREVVESFDDGTSITLRAGVALGPPAPERAVAIGGLRFSMPIDDADAGWTYWPTPAYDWLPGSREDETEGFLDRAAVLRFGGNRRIEGPGGWRDVYGRVDGPKGAQVTLPEQCGVYRVFVDPSHIGVRPDSDLASVTGPPRPRTGWVASAATTVTWPDGTVAGKVVSDTELFGEPTIIDARTCYRKRLHWATSEEDFPREDGTLLLCFPSESAP